MHRLSAKTARAENAVQNTTEKDNVNSRPRTASNEIPLRLCGAGHAWTCPDVLKSADCGTFVPEVPGMSLAWRHLEPVFVIAGPARRDSSVIFL
jgi:hypothetical protein